MGWFSSTITDWIIAAATVGLSGAAWYVAAAELPRWRLQKDAEAWDGIAREVAGRAFMLKALAMEAMRGAETGLYARIRELEGFGREVPFQLVSVDDVLARYESEYRLLFQALEFAEYLAPGIIEADFQEIHLLQPVYLSEILRIRDLAKSDDVEAMRCAARELAVLHREDRSGQKRNPAVVVLVDAINAIRPAFSERLFGSRSRRGDCESA